MTNCSLERSQGFKFKIKINHEIIITTYTLVCSEIMIALLAVSINLKLKHSEIERVVKCTWIK